MNTPTIKELIEKATPGPWTVQGFIRQYSTAVMHGEYPVATLYSNNQEECANYIARLSPATMRKVVEALEAIRSGSTANPAVYAARALDDLNGEGAE